MRTNSISELLAWDDALIQERIAEEFAPQMDREQLFQRSMAKYRGTAEPVRQNKPVWKRTGFRAMTAAACLLLTVGLGVGIWSKQQKIESRPPQETPVTAVTETENLTETHPETTAPVATAAQTTVRQTKMTTKTSECAAESAVSTVPVTTAVQTTAVTVPAVLQTSAVSVTEIAQTSAAPQTTAAAETSFAPSAKPPVISGNPVQPETIAPETQTMEMQTETVPETESPTEAVIESAPELAEEQLTGFRVEQYADHRTIVCTDHFPAPDGELQPYVVISEELTLLSASEPETSGTERSYEIECADAGKTFTVTQREYTEFVLTVAEGELIDISLNRAHGFFLLQEETCSLYWFRDGEGFYISGDSADLKYLMAIARSFTPAGENE